MIAGITLKQAQVLEWLFLAPDNELTYAGLAHLLKTNNQVVGRMVSTLRKKGMAKRTIDRDDGVFAFAFGDKARDLENPIPCDEWIVELGEKAWELRSSFKEWDEWITPIAVRAEAEYRKKQASKLIANFEDWPTFAEKLARNKA